MLPKVDLKIFIFVLLNMGEDDVATKAPESDVHEPSMISSADSSAQQGASMGVNLPLITVGTLDTDD